MYSRIVLLLLIVIAAQCISLDNICTFHVGTRLFSLLYLQPQNPYKIPVFDNDNNNTIIQFTFCQPFIPKQCKQNTNQTSAYSFIIKKQYNQQNIAMNQSQCISYSSNSLISSFQTHYQRNNQKILTLNLFTNFDKQQQQQQQKQKQTQIKIYCAKNQNFKINKYKIIDNKILIEGQSIYGCPIFQMNSLWETLIQHRIIFGIILFILGFQMLFFGRVMIHVTIFITTYFMCFIILCTIATVFLTPQSNKIIIYFTLLLILFISIICAYGIIKMMKISFFFIGAFFGFLLGAIVNSIFSKIFSIYSVWSLVFFQVISIIFFGFLTFKFHKQVIVVLTSLTGSYMIIRPISWIFGGFPNQFLLYYMIQYGHLDTLPWTFFIYLVCMITVAILGAIYQFLKLQREGNGHEIIETNFISQTIEPPIDKIKQTVDQIIARYNSDHGEDYTNMNQMKEHKQKQIQFSTDAFIEFILSELHCMQNHKQTDSTVEKLEYCNKLAYKMQQVGMNTNVQLHAQGQKLHRQEQTLKDINKEIKKMDKTSKKMTSFWYNLKQKIKGYVYYGSHEQQINRSNIQNKINKKNEKNIIQLQPNQEQKIDDKEQMINSKEEIINKQDQLLDQLCQQMKHLKKLGKSTEQQLNQHNKVIINMDNNIGKNHDKMQSIRKRLHKKFL